MDPLDLMDLMDLLVQQDRRAFLASKA